MTEKKAKRSLREWVAHLGTAPEPEPLEPPPGALCRHAANLKEVQPKTKGCAECLASGEQWVSLRMCMLCGHVGCCDSSRGKHATEHFRDSHHPLVRSLEPDESWGWCYFDQQELDGRWLPKLSKR